MPMTWKANTALPKAWTAIPQCPKSLRTKGEVSQHIEKPTPNASPIQPFPPTSLALQSQAIGAQQTQ